MAITRTAMIDDDGSQTTGTIFNNAWKTELYNQIDDLPLTVRAIYHGSPPGGTINDWDLPSLGNYTMFQLSPAGATVITGIKAMPSGTIYLIHNNAVASISFTTVDPASAVGNRIYTKGLTTFTLTSWQSVALVYDANYPGWLMLS